ncbi:zinc-ribbon domain-containing protein [Vaginella massiliensis]|uniref:zinc-ribbon domain-containing protein n=1 Tax=Vaginella massiliensis TaxID=1816680 RepID=UPI0008392CC1|nr:zinc-ribbon domain-containing protein [Vaginella massiliensis]
MIFIGGVSTKGKTLEEGYFQCPICQQQRQYKLRSYRKHLSLFFIPVVPIGKSDETVTCQYCKTEMPTSVLKQ